MTSVGTPGLSVIGIYEVCSRTTSTFSAHGDDINGDTTDRLQVVALELQYLADEGVELLVPMVLGEEAAERKAADSRRTDGPAHAWTSDHVVEALRGNVSDEGLAAAIQLIA